MQETRFCLCYFTISFIETTYVCNILHLITLIRSNEFNSIILNLFFSRAFIHIIFISAYSFEFCFLWLYPLSISIELFVLVAQTSPSYLYYNYPLFFSNVFICNHLSLFIFLTHFYSIPNTLHHIYVPF